MRAVAWLFMLVLLPILHALPIPWIFLDCPNCEEKFSQGPLAESASAPASFNTLKIYRCTQGSSFPKSLPLTTSNNEISNCTKLLKQQATSVSELMLLFAKLLPREKLKDFYFFKVFLHILIKIWFLDLFGWFGIFWLVFFFFLHLDKASQFVSLYK